MRIPWYIYAPLSLIIIFLTLYLCIKDNDPVTPPSPEATAESLQAWRADNPSLKNTKLNDPSTEPKPRPKDPKLDVTPPKPKPAPTPVVKIPATSPDLNSLVQLNLTTAQLTSYAEHMLKNGKPQLARIAYERVIDCAKDATAEDRKLAAAAISNLLSQTPLWNPDPSVRKKFSITITINEEYKTSAETLIAELETLVFDASDGMLEPSIEVSSSDSPLSSLMIENDDSPVRFSIKNNSEFSPKIHAALYNAIRNKQNQSQKLTSTPALPKDISPQQALQTYITRLSWVNAAN